MIVLVHEQGGRPVTTIHAINHPKRMKIAASVNHLSDDPNYVLCWT